MEQEIKNAVEALNNPAGDRVLAEKAMMFLQDVRNNYPESWRACASLFVSSPQVSTLVRYASLDILNSYLKSQRLDAVALNSLKDVVLNYIRHIYRPSSTNTLDSQPIQNKLAQTVTYLFISLYQHTWVTFLDDMLDLTAVAPNSPPEHTPGVIFYLRVLSSLHDEIADVFVSRPNEDVKRNAIIKDAIRSRDMARIVQSLHQILAIHLNKDDDVILKTLVVLGKWVAWTDIRLVVTPAMINVLLPLVGRLNADGKDDAVRHAAIATFTEIATKKMKPADKLDLIAFLNLRGIITELADSPPLSRLSDSSDFDVDLGESVGNLVNSTVSDIVTILGADSNSPEVRAKAEEYLHDFLPLLLRFFTNEYDEICSSVLPALTELLGYMKKLPKLTPRYINILPHILKAIIAKMRYDETSTWGDEYDAVNEAEFVELRKKLQSLQKSVAAINLDLFIEVVSNMVAAAFGALCQNGANMDWRDLELALNEVYLFGEIASSTTKQGIDKSQAAVPIGEAIAAMLSRMIQSDMGSFNHPSIQLHYLEICSRYSSFFEANRQFIEPALASFVKLMHTDHARVRSRSWYLFQRFVYQLRGHVGVAAEHVIGAITDLLPIKAELAKDSVGSDATSDAAEPPADALFKSQLYLYEAAGCIASTSATPADKQAMFARLILSPVFADIEAHLEKARAGHALAVTQIHHLIMAMGTLAEGFSTGVVGTATEHPLVEQEVIHEFRQAEEAVLVSLQSLGHSDEIRTAARFAFSRLLKILGAKMLPQLQRWANGLLLPASTREETTMFLRLLDHVIYEFKSDIYSFLDIMLTPLVQKVLRSMAETPDGTDEEFERIELRRAYLNTLNIILTQHLGRVFVSDTNQGILGIITESVQSIAKAVAFDCADVSSSRYGFMVMKEMVKAWGGPNVAVLNSSNGNGATTTSPPAVPGFDEWILQNFHRTCWDVLRDPQFKQVQDAQARLVLAEIGALEQEIYLKTGDKFVQAVRNELATLLGPGGPDDYVKCIVNSPDKKTISRHLLSFLKSRNV